MVRKGPRQGLNTRSSPAARLMGSFVGGAERSSRPASYAAYRGEREGEAQREGRERPGGRGGRGPGGGEGEAQGEGRERPRGRGGRRERGEGYKTW